MEGRNKRFKRDNEIDDYPETFNIINIILNYLNNYQGPRRFEKDENKYEIKEEALVFFSNMYQEYNHDFNLNMEELLNSINTNNLRKNYLYLFKISFEGGILQELLILSEDYAIYYFENHFRRVDSKVITFMYKYRTRVDDILDKYSEIVYDQEVFDELIDVLKILNI